MSFYAKFRRQIGRVGMLEVLFATAVLSLGAQLFFPGVAERLLGRLARSLDVRNWSWSVRVLANLAVIFAFIVWRSFPEIRKGFTECEPPPARGKKRKTRRQEIEGDQAKEARRLRDAEWAERAKNRLPFT